MPTKKINVYIYAKIWCNSITFSSDDEILFAIHVKIQLVSAEFQQKATEQITTKYKKGEVMLYHQMLREKEVLDKRERTILERLQTYPAGKLIYSQNGKHKKWYISCNGQKIYIPSKEKNTAVTMAEKKYYEAMLQDILQEKYAIQGYLNLCSKDKTREEQMLETTVYSELLQKAFTSSNAGITEWEKQDYERCPKYPEQLIHPIFDGQKVRSKSEAIIATMLHVNKIPFHYEEALHLGRKVIYPDFTIRHPVTGRTYYWEHFGMMDNENYAQAAFQKMQLYNINGIMLSDTLLATYESEESPLKSNIVENMIQQYFL